MARASVLAPILFAKTLGAALAPANSDAEEEQIDAAKSIVSAPKKADGEPADAGKT